jgi:drug/metabolite transporter (DMT)-like permease
MSSAETAAGKAPLGKLVAAFAIVYVIWGSTYLAIRLAIDTLPPLMMAAIRFVTAGSILYAFLRVRGVPSPTLKQWRSGAIIGALLLAGGNTAVVFAEKTVPSGVVALLVAMVPLWMVLMEWMRPGGVRPAARTFVGLVVGFAGMILLVGPGGFGGGAVHLAGALIVMAGSMAWAFGSIYSRQAELPANPLMATATEMLSAGALLSIGTLVTGEAATVRWSAVSATSMLSVAYLVVFGSLVAFSAYVWLLGASTPAMISTYAYVNPVVAVFLGWLVLGEPITARVLVAAAVIIAAVAIITLGKKPAAQEPAEPEKDSAPEPIAPPKQEKRDGGMPMRTADGRSAA